MHIEKYFRNLVKSDQIWIVIQFDLTRFRVDFSGCEYPTGTYVEVNALYIFTIYPFTSD